MMTEKNESIKKFTTGHKLVIAAVIIGILFDLLVVRNTFEENRIFFRSVSVFWTAYMLLLYIVNFKNLKKNIPGWIIAGFALLLCMWSFIYDYNSNYEEITFLVIPGLLMGHASIASGHFDLKQTGAIFCEWVLGWIIKPFSAIPKFFKILNSSFNKAGGAVFKKIIIGVVISFFLLIIILPLLYSSDKVFGHYMDDFFRNFNLFKLIWDIIVIALAALLFFSFLWNITFSQRVTLKKTEEGTTFDSLTVSVVLGCIVFVYGLFCFVQFTYLFARVGLPIDLTYSEYARQGFWELIFVAAINLMIFGVVLRYGKKSKPLMTMISLLLAFSVFMQISAFVRLALYINNYGLTWLRLLSMWFIIYLFAVFILCAIRLVVKKLPLMSVCAIILAGWYIVLGYANPDQFMHRYNQIHVPVSRQMKEDAKRKSDHLKNTDNKKQIDKKLKNKANIY